MKNCGDGIKLNGLWSLVTQGQLSDLSVNGSLKLFAHSHHIQQGHRYPSTPSRLQTADITRFLSVPTCGLLSSSLVSLDLSGNKEMEHFTNEQEEALQLLNSFQDLSFSSCDKLQHLPRGLHKLANLRKLGIMSCPGISSLPEDGLPGSLQSLFVYQCGNEDLQQQCRNYVQSHPEIKLLRTQTPQGNYCTQPHNIITLIFHPTNVDRFS